jgi:hypothetical protein
LLIANDILLAQRFYDMNLSKHIHIPLFSVLFALVLILFRPFPTKAFADVYEANDIPWSGYWWPMTAGGLGTGWDYRGHPAPLEKLELLENGAYPGSGTLWYVDRYYDPEAPFWWGQCADWALASSYEHIAFFPSSEDNIIFRVGDKKGLMTLAHNNDIAIREDGARPEVFHYWLLYYIKDEKEAFVADLDPGEQVWSYPVFEYDMAEIRSGNTQSVTVTIFYADDNVFPDYMGTQVRTETYTYDLTLDEGGEITAGTWTGESIDGHPDGLSYPLFQRSSSPYLDYAEVSRLAHSRDDFLENGPNEVDISPGTYHLVLMDEDRYRIPCSFGDTVLVDLEQQPGSIQDIAAVLTDADGFSVEAMTVSEASSMHLVLTAQNPPYFLSLTQEDYSDPNLYTMTLDLKRSFMQQIPYLPKSGMWSGFALTNPEDVTRAGVVLATYGMQGRPIQTILGPEDLQTKEKSLFFFNDLPWRRHEYASTERLFLISEGPVSFLNLYGYSDKRMACFVQGEKRGRHLVIPDVKAPLSLDVSMSGAVINESAQEAEVQMRVYAEDGDLTREVNVSLSGGEKLPIVPGNNPFFSTPNEGWIDVEGIGNAELSGYQSLISSQSLEAVFALPVDEGRKIVPHVPPPEGWITRITLVNPNDGENRIVFHPSRAGGDREEDLIITLGPYEKREIEIQEWFGWHDGDPFFRSVVELQGQGPFVGYYTYALSSGLGDEASLPLLEDNDFRSELVLPHSTAGSGFWWTGVGIFNPTSYQETVRVEPYNDQGERLGDAVSTLPLAPGGYDVMFVESLGKEWALDISFVKFVVEEPGGVIGGFYLYGNKSAGKPITNMLSGANM